MTALTLLAAIALVLVTTSAGAQLVWQGESLHVCDANGDRVGELLGQTPTR